MIFKPTLKFSKFRQTTEDIFSEVVEEDSKIQRRTVVSRIFFEALPVGKSEFIPLTMNRSAVIGMHLGGNEENLEYLMPLDAHNHEQYNGPAGMVAALWEYKIVAISEIPPTPDWAK